MLEPPDLPSEQIIACLGREYGLRIAQLAFLPLGADASSAVYRAVAEDAQTYFVKLRRGVFAQAAVSVPALLEKQGVDHIIAPLATVAGELWAGLGTFALIVYPFVEGDNAYAANLSDEHWRAFGAVIQRLHTADFPAELLLHIPAETYAPDARERLGACLAQLEQIAPPDAIAQQLLAFLYTQRDVLRDLVQRAERLAQALQAQPPTSVVCHADLHAGNLYIGHHGEMYIIDWDTLIRAPKEHDLMFVGGAQGFSGRSPQAEEALFYAGYGQTAIDRAALAYYRYERIIQDIAIYCDELLFSAAGGADRAAALRYLMGNFRPDGTIARAHAAEMA